MSKLKTDLEQLQAKHSKLQQDFEQVLFIHHATTYSRWFLLCSSAFPVCLTHHHPTTHFCWLLLCSSASPVCFIPVDASDYTAVEQIPSANIGCADLSQSLPGSIGSILTGVVRGLPCVRGFFLGEPGWLVSGGPTDTRDCPFASLVRQRVTHWTSLVAISSAASGVTDCVCMCCARRHCLHRHCCD